MLKGSVEDSLTAVEHTGVVVHVEKDFFGKVSPCPYIEAFFGSAKCPHAHMGGGLFGGAKCPHAH